jgi:hypothetical protein
VRSDLVEVILAIEARDLKPAERVAVLEHVTTAYAVDHRDAEQLAGAGYLLDVAGRPETPGRQAEVLRRCATKFVRPKP